MLKKSKKGELEFYQDLIELRIQIRKGKRVLASFLPKFYGIEESEGKSFNCDGKSVSRDGVCFDFRC